MPVVVVVVVAAVVVVMGLMGWSGRDRRGAEEGIGGGRRVEDMYGGHEAVRRGVALVEGGWMGWKSRMRSRR